MNHRTTTLLVAIGAIAATLLAAGTVAVLGSNYSAFAHKEYKKTYDNERRDSGHNQYLKCIVVGGSDGISDNSCNNFGKVIKIPITPTPTPTPIPGGCPTDTAFDVAVQAPGLSEKLPTGTVLCLNDGTGNNKGITAIPPGQSPTTADVVVAQVGVVTRDCSGQSGFVLAKVASGTLPDQPFGDADAICVKAL